MPPLALILPVAISVVAAVAVVIASRLGDTVCRAIAACGAWASAAAVVAIWLPVRSTLELSLGTAGFGVAFGLRLDAAAVVFGLAIVLPVAMLLTLQARTWQESAVVCLGVAASLLATEASDVVLTAVAGCTAATVAVVALGIEDLDAPRPLWAILIAAWLALAWAGAQLEVASGTAGYAVVPVSALTPPVFVLIAFAAIVASGLYPWRGWASRIWSRPSLRTAAIAVALLQPIGVYLLFRAYEMGNGRYPQSLLNDGLAVWGVLVAFGAAYRAQAAKSRRDHVAEVLPALGGFALLFAAVGSELGLVAALVILVSAALLVAAIPLIAGASGPPSLLVAAAGVGMPAGLAFGGLLLGLAAAFEAGGPLGIIGLAGVATWLLVAAAAARSVRLPADSEPADSRPRIAAVLAGVALAAGPALGVVFGAGAVAASEVIPVAGPAPVLTSVATVSTDLPALTLLGPLLVIAVVALAIARPVVAAERHAHVSGLFDLPASELPGRAVAAIRRASVPAQYRSLFNPRALQGAASAGAPVLWLASILALCIAVTR